MYVVLSFALCGKRSIAVISYCLFVPLCTLPATLQAIICKSILVSWSRFINSCFFVCLLVCLFWTVSLWSFEAGWGESHHTETIHNQKWKETLSKQTEEEKDEHDRVTKTVNLKSWAVSLCLVIVNSLDPILTADQQAPSGYCKHTWFSHQDPCPYWMLKALSQKQTLLWHKSQSVLPLFPPVVDKTLGLGDKLNLLVLLLIYKIKQHVLFIYSLSFLKPR